MISIVAVILILVGLVVSIGFWTPLINRERLREILGDRYPMVYLFYGANGPALVLIGVFLIFRFT